MLTIFDIPRKFPFGQIVMTPGVKHLLPDDAYYSSIVNLLVKHGELQQGLLSNSDHKLNQEALEDGSRIFSAFNVQGEKVWVITEADRSSTCILLPGEY